MKKSCSYCGRIHDTGVDCPKKTIRLRYNANSVIDTFHHSRKWKAKSMQIQQRDLYLCQACVRCFPGTVNQYNSDNLSVHHIVPLAEDMDRCLDDDNLITLCRHHHKQADDGIISRETLIDIIIDKAPPPYDG